MGLFVHEFFCSGAYAGPLAGSSLAREGLAMLRAVLEDFARCRGGPAAVTLDRRLAEGEWADGPSLSNWARISWADSPEHEHALFQRLAAESNETFVIAPETGGCLLERRRMVEAAGSRFLGHSAETIRICTDKLAFCEHVTKHALRTIPTAVLDLSAKEFPFDFPLVVKPRDGAGSQDTYAIGDRSAFERLRPALVSAFASPGQASSRQAAIVQPLIRGHNLSVAAIADGDAGHVELFPVGEQHLGAEGRFNYQGGRIPARIVLAADARRAIVALCRSLPGLMGYIGFDLLLPFESPQPLESPELVIVEANPRLTTSYLGYRQLARENLAARFLQPGVAKDPIVWKAGQVEFDPDGSCCYSSSPADACCPKG